MYLENLIQTSFGHQGYHPVYHTIANGCIEKVVEDRETLKKKGNNIRAEDIAPIMKTDCY